MFFGVDTVSGEIMKVRWDDILMISMDNRDLLLTTNNGTYYMITKFSQVEKLLSSNGFLRSDRGVLVNCKHIQSYDSKNRLLLLDNSGEVVATVSENRGRLFMNILSDNID